jgi:hypothetical protein
MFCKMGGGGGAGLFVGRVGPPLDLLVQALEQVGRLQVVVMLARQPIKGLPRSQRRPWWSARSGQRLLDVPLDPGAELGVGRLPLGEPGRQVAPGLGEVAPVIEPTQLTQAVVVDLARYLV